MAGRLALGKALDTPKGPTPVSPATYSNDVVSGALRECLF